MKRYDLQDGDGVHFAVPANSIMLKMNDGRLTLSEFDIPTVSLEFHWKRPEPYPVQWDARGFYVEVEDATWEELQGTRPC